MEIEIKNRFTGDVILCGKYESIKDCLEKNRGADLTDIKNYSESHDVFIQLIKNKSVKFSKKQKEIASMIFAFRLCWKSIKKEYGKDMTKIFKILADLGWGEYLDKWEEQQ